MSQRLQSKFAELKVQGRGGLVTFITAGDPTPQTSEAILHSLTAAGADIIELGMPFSDPVADGPAIQLASLRAIDAGMTLAKIIQMVKDFRTSNQTTPIILMGYYNPIYHYGVDKFVDDCENAGVDGLIVVDLPPEENDELLLPAKAANIDLIHLITPTTDQSRLETLLEKSSGFLYYVSIAGITGTHSAKEEVIKERVAFIRQSTDLPIAVGFGVKTGDDVKAMTQHADAAVVGSAIVQIIEANQDSDSATLVTLIEDKVKELASGL